MASRDMHKGLFGSRYVVNPMVPTPATVTNYNLKRMVAMPAVSDRMRDMYLNHEGHYPTLHAVVTGLGFDRAQENTWKSFLRDTLAAAPNNLALRQAFYQKAREDRLDPVLSRALLLRASQYVRQAAPKRQAGMVKSGAVGPDASQTADVAQAMQDILWSAGNDGAELVDFNDLVATYGPDMLALILKNMFDEGTADFDGERFYDGALQKPTYVVTE